MSDKGGKVVFVFSSKAVLGLMLGIFAALFAEFLAKAGENEAAP